MSWLITGSQKTPVDPQFGSVSLLLHGNGTNGSTTITDSSISPLTLTNTGPVVVSTAQKKFGTGSLFFQSNSYRLNSASTSAFAFGSNDFTVEYWQKVSAPTWSFSFGVMFTLGAYGAAPHLSFGFNGSNFGVLDQPANGYSRSVNRGDDGVFHHVALARQSGVTRFFYDGSLIGITDLTTASFGDSALNLNSNANASATGITNGLYIDDLRITKGVARYTANFTPPTAPFPDI